MRCDGLGAGGTCVLQTTDLDPPMPQALLGHRVPRTSSLFQAMPFSTIP